jgi:hypothetical protein
VRKHFAVDDLTLTQRSLSWDTSIPEHVVRTRAQRFAPLEQVVGPSTKAAVLGILYEAALEQHQLRPFYNTFIFHGPHRTPGGARRGRRGYQAYVYLEASRRLAQELRRLRRAALGYTAPSGRLDSLGQPQECLQQGQTQQALLHAGGKREREHERKPRASAHCLPGPGAPGQALPAFRFT